MDAETCSVCGTPKKPLLLLTTEVMECPNGCVPGEGLEEPVDSVYTSLSSKDLLNDFMTPGSLVHVLRAQADQNSDTDPYVHIQSTSGSCSSGRLSVYERSAKYIEKYSLPELWKIWDRSGENQ